VKKFLALSAFVSGYAPSRAISVTHRLNKGRANAREPSHPSRNARFATEFARTTPHALLSRLTRRVPLTKFGSARLTNFDSPRAPESLVTTS
jgi:hypothetical protein